ncbi:MAG: leucine-rich repeat protein [Bacteroidales bacterium]|nr:leucine-rich repeat protein [Bacteroidales bacterium]
MNHDVFISYSRKDSAIADQICAALDRAGISYFIDRQGIGGGEEFPKVLAPAIKNCGVFLFLASENSYNSSFTGREITYAFKKNKGKKMLPYILDDCEMPDDLEFIFSSTNWRTMRDHPIDPVLVDDILQLLRRQNEISSKEETDSKAKEEASDKGGAKGKTKEKEDDKYIVVGTGKKVLEKEDVPRNATHVRIADGVETIGDVAFARCESLASVVIPQGVTSIRFSAFNGCKSLASVVIPQGVTSIGYGVFNGCKSLASVAIPQGVTIIRSDTFAGCKSLASVVIPEGVVSIGSRAFWGCGSLKTVVIPKSVEKIEQEAFSLCWNLKTVHLLNPKTKYRKHKGLFNNDNPTFDDHTEIVKGKI